MIFFKTLFGVLLYRCFCFIVFFPTCLQKKMDQMADLIKRLKLCVRWFKKVDEGLIQEKEKLQSELEAADKKCSDTGKFLFL